MGDEGAGAAPSADADVSAVGTLVWVRRPNGSWWPGRVVSPHEVPADCPPPTTRGAPATPILLLGRRDGPAFVDWCNLERCKRVKPFRCGDAGLEDCIRRAEEQQARRRNGRRDQRVCATGGGSGRYARKEDAVLQALDIERARLCLRSSSKPRTKPTKPSASAPAVVAAGADVQPSARPGTRKRRTPNDSEDDAPQRMKNLTDIGAPPKHATPNGLNRHLPSTSQMKRSKQSHHHHHDSTPNTKPITALDQQPCGVPRKRDRSRPLSELCNGDIWPPNSGLTPYPNGQRPGPELAAVGPVKTELDTKSCTRRAGSSNGHKPNGHTADEHLMRAGSSLATKPCSRRSFVPVKTEPVDDDEPIVVHAPLAARSVLKPDHLHVHQPCASTKAPTRECAKRASNCSKDGISSQRDSRNSRKKTTSSADHDGGNRTKNASEHDHRRERAAKHRAPSNEVILLEKRVEKSAAANKTVAPDDYKDPPVIPNGLGRVGAVLQRHSQIKCKVEEPAETISNHHSNLENVPVPSAVFKLPHQVLPPQHRDPAVARCHAAVKPVKTLQLKSSLYNVEVSAQGASSGSSSSKGGRVPLVSLMSKSSRRPVVGYPVSVEVLEAPKPCPPPAPSVDYDNRPSTSNTAAAKRPVKVEMVEEEAAAPPRRAMPPPSSSHRAGRAKAKSRRKASEDDEAWRPHTKNSELVSVPEAAPRKMRRLSSFAPSQRGGGGGGRRPPSVVGEFCHRGPALACVPLRLVFSRIHEALSNSVK